MASVGRLIGLAVWLAATGGWLAGQAPGQSVWLTGTIGELTATETSTPPALIFDAQDRPQVVCVVSSSLQHTAGDAAGGIPNWGSWKWTGISASSGPGQIFLARSGNALYVGLRPSAASSSLYVAVFDGSTWQPYTIWTGWSTIDLRGLAVDGAGQPRWLFYSEPPWGYHLATKTGAGIVPVATSVDGIVAGTHMGQGGMAVIDRFGNLHTVQYCSRREGSLLYATGPVTGPFQVVENLDAGWAVKLGQPSITIDALGMPHIAYAEEWPGYGVKHLAWTGTSWASEWIEKGGSVYAYLGIFPKILIDRVGGLHVIYSDPMHGLIKHAWKAEGAWQIEPIDSAGPQNTRRFPGPMVAAAMDSQGGLGVVYWDATGTQLKYAYRLPLDQGFVPLGLQPAVEVTNQ